MWVKANCCHCWSARKSFYQAQGKVRRSRQHRLNYVHDKGIDRNEPTATNLYKVEIELLDTEQYKRMQDIPLACMYVRMIFHCTDTIHHQARGRANVLATSLTRGHGHRWTPEGCTTHPVGLQYVSVMVLTAICTCDEEHAVLWIPRNTAASAT